MTVAAYLDLVSFHFQTRQLSQSPKPLFNFFTAIGFTDWLAHDDGGLRQKGLQLDLLIS